MNAHDKWRKAIEEKKKTEAILKDVFRAYGFFIFIYILGVMICA